MSKQSVKITALYCRLSRDDEQDGLSGSIKISSLSLKSTQRRTDSKIPVYLLTTVGRV